MTQPERARRLMLLHRYNAYVLSFLVLSGLVLFTPGFRGVLAPVRIPLKNLHIAGGLLQVGLLLAYIPLLGGHWLRLVRRHGQRLNVVLLIILATGWLASGVVIWLHRWLPESWAATALAVHDWFTWIAIPWAGVHAITRHWHWRFPLPGWWIGYSRARVFDPAEFERPGPQYEPKWKTPVTRRVALQSLGTAVGAATLYWLWRAVGGSALGGSLGVDPGYQPGATILPPPGQAAAAPAPPPTPAPPDDTGQENAAEMQANIPPQQPLASDDLPIPSTPTPTGGGRQGRFRLYTVTSDIPEFKPSTWQFSVGGLVERPLSFTWREFIHLPRTVAVQDFHCVTGWSVQHVTWEGVRLVDLLRQAGVRPAGKFVKFYSADEIYTDALPLDFASQDDILVPFLIDNALIPVPMGGPARLVVPKMYGYKSVMWLSRVEVIDADHEGFWEVRGYPNNALLPEYGGKY